MNLDATKLNLVMMLLFEHKQTLSPDPPINLNVYLQFGPIPTPVDVSIGGMGIIEGINNPGNGYGWRQGFFKLRVPGYG